MMRIVMVVWHSLMLVQTMRMNWWRGSRWWLLWKVERWSLWQFLSPCFPVFPLLLFLKLKLPPSFSRLANTLFWATRISILRILSFKQEIKKKENINCFSSVCLVGRLGLALTDNSKVSDLSQTCHTLSRPSEAVDSTNQKQQQQQNHYQYQQ